MSSPTPCPVPCSKAVGPARVRDQVATRLVDGARRHPGAHGGHPGGLGRAHHLEDPSQRGLRLAAHAEGASHVGPVTVEDGAEVHHDRVTGDDGARRGAGVGLRRVRARCHDGLEGSVLGPQAAHGGVEGEGHLVLAPALSEQWKHLAQRGVGDGGGTLHAGQLSFVLHLPQRLHHAAGDHRRRRRQVLGESALRRPADVIGLEAQAPHRRRLRARGQSLVLGLDAPHGQLDDPAQARGRQLLLGLGPVPAVGDQESRGTARAGDEEHPGGPGEAGEVADVGQCGHQQGVDLGAVEGATHAHHAPGEVHRGRRAIRYGRHVPAGGPVAHDAPAGRSASSRATALTAKP